MANYNGTPGDDTIKGSEKSDFITADAGDDIVSAGNGNDTVYAGSGDDAVSGNEGNDTLLGEVGNDTLNGNEGNDLLDGGDGADILNGGSGNDSIFGGAGNDVINGGADNDVINAGAGDDRIILSLDNDTIDGSTGTDVIDASGLNAGVTINLAFGSAISAGIKSTVLGIENVIGSVFADVITGDIGDNVLAGNGGADKLSGGLGNDTLIAGNGQGQYLGDGGNDTLVWTVGTTGSQTFDGGSGTDTVRIVMSSAQFTPEVLAELRDYSAFLADAGNAGRAYQFSALGSLTVKGAELLTVIVDGQVKDIGKLINTPPQISAESVSELTVAHGASVEGTVVATDANGDPLLFTIQNAAGQGAVTLDAATGRFIYAAGNSVGVDTFTIRVSDGQGGYADHTITVGLTNTGPVIDAGSDTNVSVSHSQTVSGVIAAVDADHDGLSFSIAKGPDHGTVLIDATTGKYVYAAGAYHGGDTFTVRVSDGYGGFTDQSVAVDVTNSAPHILSSSDSSLSVAHGHSVAGHVVAADADGDGYTFSIATGPQHGTLVFTDASGSYVYKADDYVGYDSFTIQVTDSLGAVAEHVVQVTETNSGPVIDAPTSTSFFSTTYGTLAAGSVVAFDSDGDSVTFSVTSGPAHGSVSVDASGHFTYNADDYAGTGSFTITASDGHGGTAEHRVDYGVIGTLDASSSATAVSVNLGTGVSTGVDQARVPWAINLAGSAFNDTLYGDGRANVLAGGSGKDELHGAGGNDRLDGGSGDDKIYGEDGNDNLAGGDGNDTLNGGAHNDEMRGGDGNDGFFGGGGNDKIYGEAGNDRIYGDGGDDFIRGGAGDDIMTGAGINNGGARGANTYFWDRPDVVNADGSKAGLDHITDFGVGDRMDFTGLVSSHPAAVHDAVRVTDTASGLVVAVDMGGSAGFVDVVVLDNVHGLTVDDLAHSGAITV